MVFDLSPETKMSWSWRSLKCRAASLPQIQTLLGTQLKVSPVVSFSWTTFDLRIQMNSFIVIKEALVEIVELLWVDKQFLTFKADATELPEHAQWWPWALLETQWRTHSLEPRSHYKVACCVSSLGILIFVIYTELMYAWYKFSAHLIVLRFPRNSHYCISVLDCVPFCCYHLPCRFTILTKSMLTARLDVQTVL